MSVTQECYCRQARSDGPGVSLLLGHGVLLLGDRCSGWLWQTLARGFTQEHMRRGLPVMHHLSSYIPEHGRPKWKLRAASCNGSLTLLTHARELRTWL